jgi:hypothetical protein
MPVSVPNQKGIIVVDVRLAGFMRSRTQPNRIIATFAPPLVRSSLCRMWLRRHLCW